VEAADVPFDALFVAGVDALFVVVVVPVSPHNLDFDAHCDDLDVDDARVLGIAELLRIADLDVNCNDSIRVLEAVAAVELLHIPDFDIGDNFVLIEKTANVDECDWSERIQPLKLK
jgi:hypothetical protein